MLSTAFYTLCSGTSVPWETSGNTTYQTHHSAVQPPWSQGLICTCTQYTQYTASRSISLVEFHRCSNQFCEYNVANESHTHSRFLVEVGAISFCLPRDSRAQAELSEYEPVRTHRTVGVSAEIIESDLICLYKSPIMKTCATWVQV